MIAVERIPLPPTAVVAFLEKGRRRSATPGGGFRVSGILTFKPLLTAATKHQRQPCYVDIHNGRETWTSVSSKGEERLKTERGLRVHAKRMLSAVSACAPAILSTNAGATERCVIPEHGATVRHTHRLSPANGTGAAIGSTWVFTPEHVRLLCTSNLSSRPCTSGLVMLTALFARVHLLHPTLCYSIGMCQA